MKFKSATFSNRKKEIHIVYASGKKVVVHYGSLGITDLVKHIQVDKETSGRTLKIEFANGKMDYMPYDQPLFLVKDPEYMLRDHHREATMVWQVSIHAPPQGRDGQAVATSFCGFLFQSTRPRRGATETVELLKGLDPEFQSTRPRRGATSAKPTTSTRSCCFNPRAPAGARLELTQHFPVKIRVSIHAPPQGRDCDVLRHVFLQLCFNPRAPAGARPTSCQSMSSNRECFNPRAPAGARRPVTGYYYSAYMFQSTRPRRGATTTNATIPAMYSAFQSTRPRRGATTGQRQHTVAGKVSIHAPPQGRDDIMQTSNQPDLEVSIHAPPQGRDVSSSRSSKLGAWFQSTRPRRGATIPVRIEPRDYWGFNPRAPAGARHKAVGAA